MLLILRCIDSAVNTGSFNNQEISRGSESNIAPQLFNCFRLGDSPVSAGVDAARALWGAAGESRELRGVVADQVRR